MHIHRINQIPHPGMYLAFSIPLHRILRSSRPGQLLRISKLPATMHLHRILPGRLPMILSPRLVSALLPVLLTMIFLSSCMDDDAWYEMNDLQVRADTSLDRSISRQTGVFVLNEGNFMYDNASLDYYLIDSMQHLGDVFYRTNGTPLGDVAQSMVIRDSLGYIVVNNSSKIYVININTFEFAGKITGLTSPRHMHFVSDRKAYVSDLYAGAIAIVDPVAMEILGYIDVSNPASPFNQHPTEQFVQLGNRVYTNCWSYDNTILVIDAETDRVTDSVKVPLQPNSMVADRFGKLWVLCDGGFEGNPAGHEVPALVRIDPELLEITATFEFGLNDQPTELHINGTGDTLYFLNRHLYRHIVTSDTPPEKVLESSYTKSISKTPPRKSLESSYANSLAAAPNKKNLERSYARSTSTAPSEGNPEITSSISTAAQSGATSTRLSPPSKIPPQKSLESTCAKSASGPTAEKLLESPATIATSATLATGGFYGLGIDPYSGDIYLGDAIDQVQRGVVYRYKADITVIDTFRTGINPGFFCFRPE